MWVICKEKNDGKNISENKNMGFFLVDSGLITQEHRVPSIWHSQYIDIKKCINLYL